MDIMIFLVNIFQLAISLIDFIDRKIHSKNKAATTTNSDGDDVNYI